MTPPLYGLSKTTYTPMVIDYFCNFSGKQFVVFWCAHRIRNSWCWPTKKMGKRRLFIYIVNGWRFVPNHRCISETLRCTHCTRCIFIGIIPYHSFTMGYHQKSYVSSIKKWSHMSRTNSRTSNSWRSDCEIVIFVNQRISELCSKRLDCVWTLSKR